MPVKAVTSLAYCPADTAWRTKNSTLLCCSIFQNSCLKGGIYLEALQKGPYHCDEETLTAYAEGGVDQAISGPAKQSM